MATIEEDIAAAEAALAQLMLGKQPKTVTQGDESITYNVPTGPEGIALLQQYILKLKGQLSGAPTRRRAIGVRF